MLITVVPEDKVPSLVTGLRRPLEDRHGVFFVTKTHVSRPHRWQTDRVWLLREPGSGTRATTEELFDDLGIAPRTLTLGLNGSVRASAQVNLGITLISRDAVTSELSEDNLEEWRREGLLRQRAWHLVGRAGEDLPATASLFVAHLVAATTPPMEAFRLA